MDDDYDDDDEHEFVAKKVEIIAQNAINSVVQGEQITYAKEKVNDWCRQIIEGCLKELAKLEKMFKYVVTCIIQQKNGCGLQTAATAYWKDDTDGLIGVEVETPTFSCIVTIFAISI
ncbi:unnamed protein product [Moneuplotes crassus]|uniref:Uncharacterized protein n=1 Tax=Euplotes crassus TaxID=5936 RepID=A0AAD2D9V0_EUPCR|nr:unnamed protein product [Moneuplotes crassus]